MTELKMYAANVDSLQHWRSESSKLYNSTQLVIQSDYSFWLDSWKQDKFINTDIDQTSCFFAKIVEQQEKLLNQTFGRLTCPIGGAPIGGIIPGGSIPGGMGFMLGGRCPIGIPIGGKWGGIPGGPI